MKVNVPRGLRIFYGISSKIASKKAIELIENDARSYSDFVKLYKKTHLIAICKLLGISCRGKKEEIVKKIIACPKTHVKTGGYEEDSFEEESLHWRLKNLNPWSAWVKDPNNLKYVDVLIKLRDKIKNVITRFSDDNKKNQEYNIETNFLQNNLYKIVSKFSILKQKNRISNSSTNSLSTESSDYSSFTSNPFNSPSASLLNIPSLQNTKQVVRKKRRSSLILRTGTISNTSNVDITIHNIKNISEVKQSIKDSLIKDFKILQQLAGDDIEHFYYNLSQVFDINLYFNSFVLTLTEDYVDYINYEQYIIKPFLTETFVQIQHMYALYNLVSSIQKIEKGNPNSHNKYLT